MSQEDERPALPPAWRAEEDELAGLSPAWRASLDDQARMFQVMRGGRKPVRLPTRLDCERHDHSGDDETGGLPRRRRWSPERDAEGRASA